MKKIQSVALCLLLLAVCAGCSSVGAENPATPEPSATPEVGVAPEAELTPEPTDQPEAGKYVPGIYTVNVRGMGGKFDVHVEFDAEFIVSIDVPKHHETENIGTRAFEEVIPAIIEAQSTDVDAVSGATITSAAIKTAVDEAIVQATP